VVGERGRAWFVRLTVWVLQLVILLITPVSDANGSLVAAGGMVIGAFGLPSVWRGIDQVKATIGTKLVTPLLPLLCGEIGIRFMCSASLPCAPLLVAVYDEVGPRI
jgi:hypothetical protein